MLGEDKQAYEKFFEAIKKFKEDQQKQKQRGLNDYNMVNVVRKENAEVGMHSNVIYSLIDPNGLHYQDDLFLKLFIKYVIKPELKDEVGDIFAVEAEEQTKENRRIDFTIKSDKYYIGIEMKIDAGDLDNQLYDYEKDLQKKAQKNGQKVVIFYLSKDGKDAQPNSVSNINYKKISFKEHILKWIDECQKEVRNITNLNQAFEDYRKIVKKITGVYKSMVMDLSEELENNEEWYRLAKDISESYIKAKKERSKKFLDKLEVKLKEHFDITVTKQKNRHCIDVNQHLQFRFIIPDNDGLTLQITQLNTNFQQIIDPNEKKDVLEKLHKISSKFDNGWNKSFSRYLFGDIDNLKINNIYNFIEEISTKFELVE